jgi:hypothetical protein
MSPMRVIATCFRVKFPHGLGLPPPPVNRCILLHAGLLYDRRHALTVLS